MGSKKEVFELTVFSNLVINGLKMMRKLILREGIHNSPERNYDSQLNYNLDSQNQFFYFFAK